MSTQSLTPRGFTEAQTPPNDGDVWTYDTARDKSVPKAPAGGAPTGAAGGDLAGTYPNPTVPGLLLKLATLVITDTQIKHLLGTPLTLVTPAAGTAILPVKFWFICNFANGAYVDPDTATASGVISIVDANGVSLCVGQPISDADISPSPGAALFYFGVNGTVPPAGPLIGGTAITVHKEISSLANFTGGGSGNSLTIVLFYLATPTA